MLVAMSVGATEAQIMAVEDHIRSVGLTPHESRGMERVVIGVVGDVGVRRDQVMNHLLSMPGVETVTPISRPFKLASREFHPEDTVVRVRGRPIGDGSLAIMGGPCSVESREQLLEAADAVLAAGATVLRGGAFKPRTSPYSFQGLGAEGLRYLVEARERTGLAVITEVMEPADVPLVAEHADILQVGARNMQNFPLLTAVGRTGMPVMLKRGLAATIEEWLMSAEYILSTGNQQVLLCERGIR
jgi:3-deoxy-7-phosphoheptulonate synthase